MHTIHPKTLKAHELEELYAWLEEKNVSTVRLRRDFSDVLPLAELLKPDYPRYVDLFNYPKRNSVQLKMSNWDTFNFKVLSKFNLTLSRNMTKNLANGEAGAAEVLLYEMLRLAKRQRLSEQRNAALRQEQAWEDNDEVKTIVVSKQVGDGIVQMPQKMILYSLFEEELRKNQEKEALLEAYQHRIAHMENIIKVKAERIDELLMQAGKAPPKYNVTASLSLDCLDLHSKRDGSHAPAPSAEAEGESKSVYRL